ncbi:MAG: aldehyde dehydrogenase [Candidatus Methylomirabilales bacterium]
MPDRAQNFLDGWVDSVTKATLETLNPANKGEVLGLVPRSDHRDVDRAVEVARAGWPAWARTAPRLRSEVLRRAADMLQARLEEFAGLLTRESGKLLPDAHEEVGAAVELLAGLAAEARREAGGAAWHGSSARLRAAAPVGVTAVLTPWTFPLALPAALVGAALAAGNAVVLKPSEETPLLAVRLVETLLAAGVAPSALGLVHGSGEEAGAPLVRHPEAALVAFAGFPDVAREVAIACAAEQKRALLLPGGREAAVVLEDADVDQAVARVVAGTFAALGRRRPVLHVVLQGKAGRQVQERLAEAVPRLRPGDGLLPDTAVGPLVNDRQVKRLHAYVRVGVKEGAKLLCGGEAYREGEARKGFFYTPTLLAEVAPKMRAAQEEVAGPILALLPAATPDEAVERVNRLPTGQAVSLYARDVGKALRVAAGLRAEVVRINDAGADPPEARAWLLGSLAEGGRLVDAFSRWRRVWLDAEVDAGPL